MSFSLLFSPAISEETLLWGWTEEFQGSLDIQTVEEQTGLMLDDKGKMEGRAAQSSVTGLNLCGH